MITSVALLTIRDAAAFDLFERQAVAIMVEYGGRLDSAFRPGNSGAGKATPADEIHVLKFPNLEAFQRYRADVQLAALSSLREKAIARTNTYASFKELDYSVRE